MEKLLRKKKPVNTENALTNGSLYAKESLVRLQLIVTPTTRLINGFVNLVRKTETKKEFTRVKRLVP